MASNPAVITAGNGMLLPAPFAGERILCARDGMQLDIDGVSTRKGRWSAKGHLYLSNMRLVFVAVKQDHESGLLAFDLPLAYIRADKFNQPVLGCNNLAGECWSCEADGQADTAKPPHHFKLFFMKGGVGTFLPLYFTFITAVRVAQRDQQKAEELRNEESLDAKVGQAFMDPNDPTTLFLTQPVPENEKLAEAPKYASRYGDDEDYAPLI